MQSVVYSRRKRSQYTRVGLTRGRIYSHLNLGTSHLHGVSLKSGVYATNRISDLFRMLQLVKLSLGKRNELSCSALEDDNAVNDRGEAVRGKTLYITLIH